MSRTIAHTCSHCQQVDRVPVALGYTCPDCHAAPGHPCLDQRAREPRSIRKLHPMRQALAADGDVAPVKPLRSVS